MTLSEIIEFLGREPADKAVPFGFTHAHSYRGYYDELAFEPAADTTVGAMMAEARGALGKTFTGYKGGDYTMGPYTDCWLAQYGRCGESIGPALLEFMMGRTPQVDAHEAR